MLDLPGLSIELAWSLSYQASCGALAAGRWEPPPAIGYVGFRKMKQAELITYAALIHY